MDSVSCVSWRHSVNAAETQETVHWKSDMRYHHNKLSSVGVQAPDLVVTVESHNSCDDCDYCYRRSISAPGGRSTSWASAAASTRSLTPILARMVETILLTDLPE